MSDLRDRFALPFTNTTHTTPSLPPIENITNGLRKCELTNCPQLLHFQDTCHYHERPSYPGPAEYHFHPDHSHQAAPMQWVMDHRLPSPVSSLEDTSSDLDNVYTPGSSRHTSPVGLSRSGATSQQRRSSKVALRQGNRRDSVPVITNSLDRKSKKKQKEKNCRGAQAGVTYRSEDTFKVYLGWERKEQSGGNGNSAGLYANKINIGRCMEVLIQEGLHKGHVDALRHGPAAVRDFERRIQNALDEALDSNIYAGTFLEPLGREQPCRNADAKSKTCVTHGTAGWIHCRKERAASCFRIEQERWMRENLTPDQIEAHRRAGTA